jgi:hypothetical protein
MKKKQRSFNKWCFLISIFTPNCQQANLTSSLPYISAVPILYLMCHPFFLRGRCWACLWCTCFMMSFCPVIVAYAKNRNSENVVAYMIRCLCSCWLLCCAALCVLRSAFCVLRSAFYCVAHLRFCDEMKCVWCLLYSYSLLLPPPSF